MSEWAAKRFWKTVSVRGDADGFAVLLDDRPVRTPAKRQLVVPTEVIADQIAREWEAQTERIDPGAMPWTRSANAAIDKVATNRGEVEAHLAAYAETDLLCYRAESPASLAERQALAWDPLLDWIAERYGVQVAVTAGIMPVDQDKSGLARLARSMSPMSDFQLTGFHDLVTLSGSFCLALAAAENRLPAAELWRISRIDEDWQIEEWGEDEEAAEQEAAKQAAFLHATELFSAS